MPSPPRYLRHTYATVLAENGLNPRYVQEMLGHAKLEFTLRYYTHITEKMSSAAENVNCTPFVRQYDILSNKWGVLLCQKEYQTKDIRRSSREWLWKP